MILLKPLGVNYYQGPMGQEVHRVKQSPLHLGNDILDVHNSILFEVAWEVANQGSFLFFELTCF